MMLSEVEKRYLQALGFFSGVCLIIFVARLALTGTLRYWFVPENLSLAWLGLIFGWLLVRNLQKTRWLNWKNISLTLLWLFFLPNTWYVLTDFLHVYATGEISQLFDIVMIITLVITGFTLGFTSLYLVHRELYTRLGEMRSGAVVTGVILVSSFAVYLGRVLRWNSWDVLVNPGGIILSVSDRLIYPLDYPRALNVTLMFFVLLSSIYFSIWLIFRPQAKT